MQAIIFDLDGVIADTVDFYYLANKRIADEIGVSFTRKWNQQLQGMSRRKTIDALVSKSNRFFTDEDKQKLGDKKNEFYQASIQQLTSADVLPGILPLLKQLKQEGIKVAIASSSSNAKQVVDKLGLAPFFAHIVDVQKVRRGKPDPEIFLAAAQYLGVDPAQCVAIEDGEAGLRAILQTNMFSIGVGTHEEMEAADWHVKSTEELHLEEIRKRFNERRIGR
ncbi:beta-phosphoglucomutase [Metabacillus iocasae]|uniref:Beta-phosphoglucomutase n=1 Tax=Priestia iocasae TaxID=2291674 RepID=A0ABS2QXB2_9BACI|nr:beta-phosphoglucomutase [Metabacillus iocasae]MBM7704129.1 beta-phosphoglucomutase [Metabacillus iocasae]